MLKPIRKQNVGAIMVGCAHKITLGNKTLVIPMENFRWEIFDNKTGILQARKDQMEITVKLDRRGRLDPQRSLVMTPTGEGTLWQHILSIQPVQV